MLRECYDRDARGSSFDYRRLFTINKKVNVRGVDARLRDISSHYISFYKSVELLKHMRDLTRLMHVCASSNRPRPAENENANDRAGRAVRYRSRCI